MEFISTIFEEYMINRNSEEQVFNYEYDDWFDVMTNIEITFLSSYIELYENDPKKFLERIANHKEQINNFKLLCKVSNKSNSNYKKDIVKQFFQKVPFQRFFNDLNLIAQTFDYVVEKNVAIFVFGDVEKDEITPFDENILQENDRISYNGNEITIQSILYFVFANVVMYEMDKKRPIGHNCEDEEALYVFSYVDDLHTKLKSFFIDPKKTSVVSALFANIAFSKAIRFLDDVMEKYEDEENEDLQHSTFVKIIKTLTNREQILYECYTNFLQKKIEKLEQSEKQSSNKQKELQKKLEKQKELYDQQVEKIKELKKELKNNNSNSTQNEQQETLFKEEIHDLKEQLKAAKDELKEEKKKLTKELESLKDKYDEQIEENENLKNNVSELQRQLTIEKRQKIQSEELTFEQWLQKGKEFLQGMSPTEEEQLKAFIALAENIMKEHQLARPLTELATNRIGYCRVNSEGYFINFGHGEWKKINAVPTSVYICNDQFVEVTKDLEFVQSFDYYYTEGPMDHTIAYFVVVENRNQEPFAKVNGVMTKIKYRDNILIRNEQVISINQNNEIVSYYKNRSITLDDLLPSIRLNKHEPLYVVMALANGYVVRNLNELERFIELDEDILVHSFIILDENGEVNYKDLTGNLFKRSSLYKKKLLASVSEMDEQIYVLKSNQEYVQLHDVPQNLELELGDMVWVDEYNRFIEIVEIEEDYVPDATIEQKLLESGHKVTRKSTKPQVEKDKELLIIGNVRLSERYKKYFGQFGYEVEVVDGIGPFEKIKQACSKYNMIIYTTAFTSHKNSRMMSNEISKPYIYCDSTAPKVIHRKLETMVIS